MQNVLTANLPISIMSIRLRVNLKILWFFSFLTLLSLFVVCIFQLNAYTKELYSLQNYEKRLDQLTQENKLLEIDFSRANSLANMGGLIQGQAFEKAGKIEYIRILESTALAK